MRCLIGFGILLVTAMHSGAQSPGPLGYPRIDSAFALAPGDTVQLLDRMLNTFDFGPRTSLPVHRRFDVRYTSRIEPRDTVARHAEADRAAARFAPEAVAFGATWIAVELCDTRACAETFEPPSASYSYLLIDGTWKRRPPTPPSR